MELEKIIYELGAKLYDTEITKENEKAIYRIYITSENGVNLDLCEKISRVISPLIDLNPPLHGNYFLEVSSPGLERKLSKPKHFQNSLNEQICGKTNNGEKFDGELIFANEDEIKIKNEENEEIIKISDIKNCKTYITW